MLIVYDGLCNFCNGWVRFVAERDKEGLFTFASTRSITGSKIMQTAGLSIEDPQSIILVDGDRHLFKSDAVVAILSRLGGLWALAGACRALPRPFRDFCYSQFAQRRYALFGRRNNCPLPPPEFCDRFLP
ncbi:MAG: hypothetical protein QOD42_1011 [Sphingomonadales bacterium]|jgi:predicted DCC family thiol-disulfide oxidoreductase YuxK|nr:hypothetical protein [Sphingomonadales bacterium]